jgi:hypothetical protein
VTAAYSASESLRTQERLARLNLQMARNSKHEQEQATRRRTERLGHALGILATLVAIYDLSLLTLH